MILKRTLSDANQACPFPYVFAHSQTKIFHVSLPQDLKNYVRTSLKWLEIWKRCLYDLLCYSVKSHLADSFLVRSILKNRCVIVDVLYSNRHRRGNLRRSHIRKKVDWEESKIYIDFHKSTANMMLPQLFLTQICLFSRLCVCFTFFCFTFLHFCCPFYLIFVHYELILLPLPFLIMYLLACFLVWAMSANLFLCFVYSDSMLTYLRLRSIGIIISVHCELDTLNKRSLFWKKNRQKNTPSRSSLHFLIHYWIHFLYLSISELESKHLFYQ